MRKLLFVLFIAFLLLFSITSCRDDGDDGITVDVDNGDDTDDYFDSVLDDSRNDADDEDSDGGDNADDEVDPDDEDDAVSYGEVECGDGICQYYETHSSCSEDCDELEEITLGDYPDFLEDVIIVIGDEAPSTDALTAAVIGSYLVTVDIDSETILASELSRFDDNDLILIGSPCTNLALAEFYHYDQDSCGDIISDQNNAVIKLNVLDDNEVLTITGYAEDDTLDASQMLTSSAYNLNGAEEWINMYSDGEINIYYSRN
jgi:hypothetical protein